MRALTNAAGGQRDEPVYAPPPVLDELRIASSAELLIQLAPALVDLIPWAFADGVLSLARQVPEKRKTW